MRLTTKGRFAVTAMIDIAIAMQCGNGPISLAEISQRQNISLSYLEQLFRKLRCHKLVDSVRGPGGGYLLAKPPQKISVADIILAVDEPLDATDCGNKKPCKTGKNGRKHGRCMTHDLWSQLNKTMLDFLDSVCLDQLAMRNLPTSVDDTTPLSRPIVVSNKVN